MKATILLSVLFAISSSLWGTTEAVIDKQHADSLLLTIDTRIDKLDYSAYLKEVLNLIKEHPEIDHNENEVHVGSLINDKVVEKFKSLPERIRDQLDKLKRQELKRLHRFQEALRMEGHPEEVLHKSTAHVHVPNNEKGVVQTFTESDLKRLIEESKNRLAEIDKVRREQFKEYEMLKLLEYQELTKRLSPEEQETQKEIEHLIFQHYFKSKPMNPLAKEHLLDVWAEKDHMEKTQFNMKTFFVLHDLDGNKLWDEDELKIVVMHEVARAKEDPGSMDYMELREEVDELMDQALKDVDKNQDFMISLEEFIDYNKRTGISDLHFWEAHQRYPEITEEEFHKFAEAHRAEVNRLIDEGKITLPDPSQFIINQMEEGLTDKLEDDKMSAHLGEFNDGSSLLQG